MPENRLGVPMPRLVPARKPAPPARVAPAPLARSPRTAQTMNDSIVAWAWYVDGRRQDCDDLGFATSRAKVGNGFVWLGLNDPDDEDMAEFARSFDLHPLAIEDAVEGHTRSKVEQFDETTFAVLSTVAYLDHAGVSDSAEIVSTGQIMVFVGPGFAMTVRQGPHSALANLRRRLENDDDGILTFGPSAVLYGVVDKIVDDYNRVVHEFETDIDEIEELTFARQRTHQVDGVYQLKRELIEFKRAVTPLGPALMALSTRPFAQVPEDMRPYFRELSDHHTEARESIASFDEVLNSLLQAALARASVEDNQDMRKLSATLGILAIPTMIFGWYGMNFKYMPELELTFGYPLILVLTALMMLGAYGWFRRKGWL